MATQSNPVQGAGGETSLGGQGKFHRKNIEAGSSLARQEGKGRALWAEGLAGAKALRLQRAGYVVRQWGRQKEMTQP